MPANIGAMFYYGEIPWHEEGTRVEEPLNIDDAIRLGGLGWGVEMIELQTAEDPPSPVLKRKAIVRKDKKPGDEGRVIGVAHNDFKPLQNEEGVRIFDSIFGRGKKVYHTGGYLGGGEKIWLLASLPKVMKITKRDIVKPYALFTNSHDGSVSIDVRLTAVRVVCQNTLSLALKEKNNQTVFKRSHQGSYQNLQKDIEYFFEGTLKAADDLETTFIKMSEIKFDDGLMGEFVDKLFPIPIEPASQSQRAYKSYLTRKKKAEDAREIIGKLQLNGKGTEFENVRGTLWGSLNAVLEYVDHHADRSGYLIQGLFGARAMLKTKAFTAAVEYINA